MYSKVHQQEKVLQDWGRGGRNGIQVRIPMTFHQKIYKGKEQNEY